MHTHEMGRFEWGIFTGTKEDPHTGRMLKISVLQEDTLLVLQLPSEFLKNFHKFQKRLKIYGNGFTLAHWNVVKGR